MEFFDAGDRQSIRHNDILLLPEKIGECRNNCWRGWRRKIMRITSFGIINKCFGSGKD